MGGFGKSVAVCSAAHFAVDFCCAFYVLSNLNDGVDKVICLLVYNFCAFALQMPAGAVLDSLGGNRMTALSGMALVGLGAFLGKFPLVLCIVAGIGNALFHVGGGREVLCGSEGKLGPLGLFVSPGALGLFLGGLIVGQVFYYLPLAILALTAFGLWRLMGETEAPAAERKEFRNKEVTALMSAALALFAVVCLRSYGGGAFVFPWKTGTIFSLLLTLALVFGKAMGGVLADRLGVMRISVLSLFLCGICFLFYENPMCGLAAVFLFNMTMPITLGMMYRLMPGSPGFGFGLLTFALFLGALPAILGTGNVLTMPLAGMLAAGLSLVLLVLAEGGMRRRGR